MSSARASVSCRSVNGLLRKPFAPFSMASMAVALSLSAETTRMRTAGFNCTICSMHWIPSICGIVRSIVTTSGSVRLKSFSASTPLAAAPTNLRFANCWERSIRRRMMFESSTIISLKVRCAPGCTSLRLFAFMQRAAALRDGAFRRLHRRQCNLEAREFARIRTEDNPAAECRDSAGHHVHADAATAVHCDALTGRQPRAEDESHDGARIQVRSLGRRHEILSDRGGLELIKCKSRPVGLDHEFVTVGEGAELGAHEADLVFRVGAAHVRRLDSMQSGIAQHLDQHVAHRRAIGRRNLRNVMQRQAEFLLLLAIEARRETLQRRCDLLGCDRGLLCRRLRRARSHCAASRAIAQRRDPCRKLTDAAQMRKQIIELEDERQEIISCELGALLEFA